MAELERASPRLRRGFAAAAGVSLLKPALHSLRSQAAAASPFQFPPLRHEHHALPFSSFSFSPHLYSLPPSSPSTNPVSSTFQTFQTCSLCILSTSTAYCQGTSSFWGYCQIWSLFCSFPHPQWLSSSLRPKPSPSCDLWDLKRTGQGCFSSLLSLSLSLPWADRASLPPGLCPNAPFSLGLLQVSYLKQPGHLLPTALMSLPDLSICTDLNTIHHTK